MVSYKLGCWDTAGLVTQVDRCSTLVKLVYNKYTTGYVTIGENMVRPYLYFKTSKKIELQQNVTGVEMRWLKHAFTLLSFHYDMKHNEQYENRVNTSITVLTFYL